MKMGTYNAGLWHFVHFWVLIRVAAFALMFRVESVWLVHGDRRLAHKDTIPEERLMKRQVTEECQPVCRSICRQLLVAMVMKTKYMSQYSNAQSVSGE